MICILSFIEAEIYYNELNILKLVVHCEMTSWEDFVYSTSRSDRCRRRVSQTNLTIAKKFPIFFLMSTMCLMCRYSSVAIRPRISVFPPAFKHWMLHVQAMPTPVKRDLLKSVWNDTSIFDHFPRMFLSTDFAFRITDWTSCHGPHIYMLH